jgi:PAS domain S-box-containing protein
MTPGAAIKRTTADELTLERERASLALSAADMGEFEWTPADDRLLVSERMAAITGSPAGFMPAEAGMAAFRGVHPEDAEGLRQAVADGLARRQRFEATYRVTHPRSGQLRWMFSAGVAVADEAGGTSRVIGVVRDITQSRGEAEARDAMVAELDHRVKNVLASVQSLAAQSARRTTSVEAFLKTFTGRLEAMASAHTLLTATRWRGAEITHVAAAELGGLAPGQARWWGPEIVLNPRATSALTLALHELATNALKYGALSIESGRIELSWAHRAGGGFELNWVETGGPPVSPPQHRGFGSTLLDRVTGRELGGETKMEFRHDGLRVRMTADASALAAAAPPPAPVAASPSPEAAEPQTGASAGSAIAAAVKGRRILIVEDAVLLALELESGLVEAGAQVVGMAADIEEAMRLIETPFDVAVLDANLNGQSIRPVAEILAARGKPFIIATGYSDMGLSASDFDAPVVRKPYNVNQIAAAVGEALARR